MTSRRDSRLLILIGVLVAAIVLTWIGTRTVDAVVGVLLLFIVPGWLITSWPSHFGARLSAAERLFWMLLVGVGVVVLAGLLLNVTGGLTRRNWIIGDVGIVLVLLAIEWLIVLRTQGAAGGRGDRGDGSYRGPVGDRRPPARRWHLPVTSPMNIALVVMSILLVVSALWLSEVSTADHDAERVIQLSMKPIPISEGSFASSGELGVGNRTGGPVAVVVHLYSGGARDLIHTWTLQLGEGQQWSAVVTRAHHVPLSATVAYVANPSVVIASVSLGTPVQP